MSYDTLVEPHTSNPNPNLNPNPNPSRNPNPSPSPDPSPNPSPNPALGPGPNQALRQRDALLRQLQRDGTPLRDPSGEAYVLMQVSGKCRANHDRPPCHCAWVGLGEHRVARGT